MRMSSERIDTKTVYKDLTNQSFGKLVAVRPTDSKERKRGVEWLCLCECGNYCTVVCEDLCSGATKSCGC